MKAGRQTIGNFALMPTHGTRHSKAHKETIGQFDRNSLASPQATKEQSMRNSLSTEQECEEGPQTVFFQIANGNARQACSVKTKFATQQQASRYLRQNWVKIEKMARDCLANGTFENGRIKLVML